MKIELLQLMRVILEHPPPPPTVVYDGISDNKFAPLATNYDQR